jgi:hypothetical protein
VRHVHKLELERAQRHPLARLQHLERRVAGPMLLELRAHEADRQGATVDHRGHPDLPQDERQRADVVLVPVGEDDRLDIGCPVTKVGEVRQHQVDPEHLGGGKHQSRVDDHDPTVVLDHGHVLADLAEPPQGQDLQ